MAWMTTGSSPSMSRLAASFKAGNRYCASPFKIFRGRTGTKVRQCPPNRFPFSGKRVWLFIDCSGTLAEKLRQGLLHQLVGRNIRLASTLGTLNDKLVIQPDC